MLSAKGTAASVARTTNKEFVVHGRRRIHYLKARAITSLTQTYARLLQFLFRAQLGSVSTFLLSAVLGTCRKASVAFTACSFEFNSMHVSRCFCGREGGGGGGVPAR